MSGFTQVIYNISVMRPFNIQAASLWFVSLDVVFLGRLSWPSSLSRCPDHCLASFNEPTMTLPACVLLVESIYPVDCRLFF